MSKAEALLVLQLDQAFLDSYPLIGNVLSVSPLFRLKKGDKGIQLVSIQLMKLSVRSCHCSQFTFFELMAQGFQDCSFRFIRWTKRARSWAFFRGVFTAGGGGAGSRIKDPCFCRESIIWRDFEYVSCLDRYLCCVRRKRAHNYIHSAVKLSISVASKHVDEFSFCSPVFVPAAFDIVGGRRRAEPKGDQAGILFIVVNRKKVVCRVVDETGPYLIKGLI